MKTSKTVAYALACIAELAKKTGEFVQVSEIAQAQNLPAAYCQKILLSLSRAGIVMSVKGQGFTLILPPESLTTLRVLQALQETESIETKEITALKTISDTLSAKVNGALASLTVAELLIAAR